MRDVVVVVLALALGGIALGFALGCGGEKSSDGSSDSKPKKATDVARDRPTAC